MNTVANNETIEVITKEDRFLATLQDIFCVEYSGVAKDYAVLTLEQDPETAVIMHFSEDPVDFINDVPVHFSFIPCEEEFAEVCTVIEKYYS
jgi:hypothetical protein